MTVVKLLAIGLLSLALQASAATLPAKDRDEVDALLSRLETSGCQFNRNGSWYSGAEAKVHLSSKREYLEGKSALQTTEQFIELAATSSSMTGVAYQVKCKDTAAVPSRAWLLNELKQVRASGS